MKDDSDFGQANTMAGLEQGPAAHVGVDQVEDLREGLILSETYRLISRLGEGGMGEVWKAEHLRLPKPVAIKVLHKGMASSEEVEARFRREAEIGSRLAHPHIVDVTDFNELPDGRKYIVMDLLEGESLADRMDRGAIPYEEIVVILKQAALGLQVAHDAGVVHRDLKPDNIFLCADPTCSPPFRVKLLDFGISKIQNAERSLTQDMAVMGTPGYMAPEQARGHTASLGPEADQFSLATIAYEMVAGCPAFDGQTLVEIIFKLVHEEPKPIDVRASGVPEYVAAALGKAMAKEPEQRFDSIQAFVATFSGAPPSADAMAQTLAATAVSPSASEPAVLHASLPAVAHGASPPPQSNALLFIGLGVAIIGACLAAFALFWESSRSHAPQAAAVAAPGGEVTAGSAAPEKHVPEPMVVASSDASALTSDSSLETDEDAPGDDVASADKSGVADKSSVAGEGSLPDEGSLTNESTSNENGENETEVAAKVGANTNRAKATKTALSPEAEGLVSQAESALAAGDGSRALTFAERALRAQNVPEARAALAKAYCLKRDRGAANAAKRGLPRALARRVDSFCKRALR